MSGSCEVDISHAVGKFYSKSEFNNIMAVLEKQNSEMVAVHLMQSYCLSSLLCVYETWSLTNSRAHSANVALNNSFRRIFNCCLKLLLYYCRTLPNVLAVDQRRILFYKKLKRHSSVLLRVLAIICYREILFVATKYNIQCLDISIGNIKNCIWKSFSDSVI